jgi:hypothetical protein
LTGIGIHGGLRIKTGCLDIIVGSDAKKITDLKNSLEVLALILNIKDYNLYTQCKKIDSQIFAAAY